MSRDLRLSEAKTIVDKLADADVMILSFSGGEPLLRNDIEELARYARDKGLIVALSTNGTLITRSRARRLVESFHSISISLDGLSDVHDRIRGKKGTYDKAIQGLKHLTTTNSGCQVGVNLVLNKLNFQELHEVFETVKSTGANFFSIQQLLGSSSLMIPKDTIKRLTEQILGMKMNHWKYILQSCYFIGHIPDYVTGTLPKLCDAGRLYLVINNEGKLFLCPGLPRTEETYIGSLLQHSLVDLLKSDKLKRVKDAIVPKCPPCLMTCTTEFSLLGKSPLKTILRKYGGFKL